ncbi:OTU-like cysteine protease, putative [Bodo saltans]|uniref:OTU-like cysteine protease, putative n=1 Tax=Bodo saltans TaxID=75058 RepID=A0A0S4KIY2_BODSA|nr:OTU-like cysteine protease, putative [Bodo saltans]|eukprot:CUI14536.1 OTU-like cysteine protease, putative [Bodo saltans]
MSGRLQSGTPHLAALIRAKLTREGSPAAGGCSAYRRVSDAAARRSEGGRCCWLCSNEIRTSNRGESVYLVDNACGATGEGCPCLCAGCFLVAYLTLRDSFPSSQERLVTHRKLEAKFDASVDQLLSGTSSAVANAVAAETGLGLSQTATATQRETLFVNSYSLRSFVAVDADAASEASSPPPTTPSMVPFSKSSRAVPTPPSVLGAVGDWQCPQCTLVNTAASGNVVRCSACNATNPEAYPCHCCSTLLHPRLFQLGKAPLRCAVRVSPPAPPPHPPTTHISPTTTPRSMHSNTSPPHPPTTRPASKRTSAPPLLFDNSTVASTQVVDSFVKRNSVLSPLGRSISSALDFIKSDSQPATTTANSVSTKTVTLEALRHQLWVCDSCTLVNVRATRCCEMCGGPRQVACGKCTLLNSVPAIAYQTHAAPSVSCEICTKPIAIPDVDARLAAFAFDSKQQQPLDVSMTSSMMREARRSDDIVKGERRLRHRVEKQLHAFMRVQVGDGSCLFRAISDELFGQPLLHQVVRHLICSYMASPEARGGYSLYFESDSVYDGYLQRLAQEGTWGDELCIHAASQLFHTTITVISSMETYWSQTFQAPLEGNDDDEARTSSTNNKQPIRIFLAYTNPVHFDSIRLERSAPPSSGGGDETSSATMMGQLLHSLTESLLEERQWTDAGHDHAMIASKANTDNEWHMVHTEDHQ